MASPKYIFTTVMSRISTWKRMPSGKEIDWILFRNWLHHEIRVKAEGESAVDWEELYSTPFLNHTHTQSHTSEEVFWSEHEAWRSNSPSRATSCFMQLQNCCCGELDHITNQNSAAFHTKSCFIRALNPTTILTPSGLIYACILNIRFQNGTLLHTIHYNHVSYVLHFDVITHMWCCFWGANVYLQSNYMT